MQNCGQVEFEFLATSEKPDAEELCSKDPVYGLHNMDDLSRRMHWLEMKANEGDLEFCPTKMLTDLAYIGFEMTKPNIDKVIKRRRVTFTDMLGTLGGYNFEIKYDCALK